MNSKGIFSILATMLFIFSTLILVSEDKVDAEEVIWDGPVLYVGETSTYRNITDAVNNATSGTTIKIEEGIYTENIAIKKNNLTIIGNGTGCVLDHSNLTIQAKNINISSLHFSRIFNQSHFGRGKVLWIEHSENVTILDVRIETNGDFTTCIRIDDSKNVTMNRCWFNASGGAIYMLVVDGVNGLSVKSSLLEGPTAVKHFFSIGNSVNISIVGNDLYAVLGEHPFMFFRSVENVEIAGNRINASGLWDARIYFNYCNSVVFKDNDLAPNSNCGLKFSHSEYVKVHDNIALEQDWNFMDIEYTFHVEVFNNILDLNSSNSHLSAFKETSSADISIHDNTIKTGGFGVSIYSYNYYFDHLIFNNNITITNNDERSFGYAISVSESGATIFNNNVIVEGRNNVGIRVRGENVSVHNNTVIVRGEENYGVMVEGNGHRLTDMNITDEDRGKYHYPGIYIRKAKEIDVKNCLVTTNYGSSAIYLKESEDCSFEGVRTSSSTHRSTGLAMYECKNIDVQSCQFEVKNQEPFQGEESTRYIVYADSCENLEIRNNLINGFGWGLGGLKFKSKSYTQNPVNHIIDSNNISIQSGEKGQDINGVHFEYMNATLSNNWINISGDHTAAVKCEYSNVEIINNRMFVRGDDSDGILSYWNSRPKIENNTISVDGEQCHGIHAQPYSNFYLKDLQISVNGTRSRGIGIYYIQIPANLTISDCNIQLLDESSTGIISATDMTIMDTTISGLGGSLLVSSGATMTLIDCRISDVKTHVDYKDGMIYEKQHIRVKVLDDDEETTVEGIDVRIMEGNRTKYATEAYSGSDQMTDVEGLTPPLLILDRVHSVTNSYSGPDDINTNIEVKDSDGNWSTARYFTYFGEPTTVDFQRGYEGPIAPEFNILPEYTNKVPTFYVSGIYPEGTDLYIVHNDVIFEYTEYSDPGVFGMDIYLEEGNNTIHAYSLDRDEYRSPDSKKLILFLDTEKPVPVINITGDLVGGFNWTLFGCNSTDNFGIDNWEWSIKRGRIIHTESGPNLTYFFTWDGGYEIKLKVTDLAGNVDTMTIEIYVYPFTTKPVIENTFPPIGSTLFMPFEIPFIEFDQDLDDLTIIGIRTFPKFNFETPVDRNNPNRLIIGPADHLDYGSDYRIEIDYGLELFHHLFPNSTYVLEFTTLDKSERNFTVNIPEGGFRIKSEEDLIINGTSYGFAPGTYITIQVGEERWSEAEILDNYTWVARINYLEFEDEIEIIFTIDDIDRSIIIKEEEEPNANLLIIIIAIIVLLIIIVVLGYLFSKGSLVESEEE